MSRRGGGKGIGWRSRRLARYIRFVFRLLRDSVRRYPYKALRVVVFSILGVLLQFFALAVIISYASAVASDEPLPIFGYSFGSRDSVGGLVVALAACCSALLLSAAFVYRSRVAIIGMAREYENFCAVRILDRVSPHILTFSRPDGSAVDSKFLLDLARKDSRARGRVLRITMDLSYPVLSFIIASGIILYLNTLLTLVVAVIAACSLFIQARISRAAAAASLAMEQHGRTASAIYKEHVNGRLDDPDRPATGDDVLRTPGVVAFMAAFDRRLRSIEHSRLTSAIVISITLGVILLILGAEIISGGAGWKILLIYVVASRYAMTSLQSILLGITSVNRFYPQLRRYSDFIDTTGKPHISPSQQD